MSCIYREKNNCEVTKNICPWVMWCSKINNYKERAGVDKYCKYKNMSNIPDGYSKVAFEKKGFLYIDVENETIKIKNPYDYTPLYVKLFKSKGEWKIRKEKEKEQ